MNRFAVQISSRLRLVFVIAVLLPLIVACSGPDDDPAPTATSPPAVTLAPEPEASATSQQATMAAPPEPTSAPTPTATEPAPAPTLDLPVTPALKPTLAETAAPDQAAPVEATPWLPEERPADQLVELPDLDLHYALHISELSVSRGYV